MNDTSTLYKKLKAGEFAITAELSPPKVPDLKAAIRRARIEEAERSAVASDMRAAELARLEMLRDALVPVYAQLPTGLDVFDLKVR